MSDEYILGSQIWWKNFFLNNRLCRKKRFRKKEFRENCHTTVLSLCTIKQYAHFSNYCHRSVIQREVMLVSFLRFKDLFMCNTAVPSWSFQKLF